MRCKKCNKELNEQEQYYNINICWDCYWVEMGLQ